MKRSAIEAAIAAARLAFADAGLRLPPFADWDRATWAANADSHAAQVHCGWDVTDFGRGDFERQGLTLFTMRNGRIDDLREGRGFCYAEKALFVGEGQVTPLHRHYVKVEDIIVRGEGTLVLELRHDRDGEPDRTRGAKVMCDGVWRETGPDGLLKLGPGESVTLTPDIWHGLWAEGGPVVAGEVSSVNDDATDNLFETPLPRFPVIEEDVPAATVLVSER